MRPDAKVNLSDAEASFNPRICKRCDKSPLNCALMLIGFNPRICKRCDGYQRPWYEYVQFQSTHL